MEPFGAIPNGFMSGSSIKGVDTLCLIYSTLYDPLDKAPFDYILYGPQFYYKELPEYVGSCQDPD